MCPHCRKSAPIVNRGLLAHCAACGGERFPFTETSVSLAGKPSSIGGAALGVLGWVVMAGGVFLALLVGFVLAAIFPASVAGLAVGLTIGLAAVASAVLMLLGARKLRRSGAHAARETRTRALFALAAHRGGLVTAREAAAALDLPEQATDDLLTELCKQRDDVDLEIDDRGGVFYRFGLRAGRLRVEPPRVRVGGVELEAEPLEDDAATAAQRRRRAR